MKDDCKAQLHKMILNAFNSSVMYQYSYIKYMNQISSIINAVIVVLVVLVFILLLLLLLVS